jgi:hypothetical protein
MLVRREKLIAEILRMTNTTSKNPDSRNLTKRELMHLLSYMRIQENTITELHKRVKEAEGKK